MIYNNKINILIDVFRFLSLPLSIWCYHFSITTYIQYNRKSCTLQSGPHRCFKYPPGPIKKLSTVIHIYGAILPLPIFVLLNPSTFFTQPPAASSLGTVSLFSVSMSLFLFCLFILFFRSYI